MQDVNWASFYFETIFTRINNNYGIKLTVVTVIVILHKLPLHVRAGPDLAKWADMQLSQIFLPADMPWLSLLHTHACSGMNISISTAALRFIYIYIITLPKAKSLSQ